MRRYGRDPALRRVQPASVGSDGRRVEVNGSAAAGGDDDGLDDVGDEVGFVAVDEVAGGVGDDMLRAESMYPFALVALPALVNLGEGEWLPPAELAGPWGLALPAAVRAGDTTQRG